MTTDELSERFHIAITAKMRHGDLWAAAKRLGSVKALADALGVNQSILGKWVNLKGFPRSNRMLTEERRRKLVEVVGKSFEELWPEPLCEAIRGGGIKGDVEIAKDIGFAELAGRAAVRGLLPSPLDVAEAAEMRDQLRRAMGKLRPRERLVLELRHGLDGHSPHNLAETGRAVGISKERVRQVIARAQGRLADHLEAAGFDVAEAMQLFSTPM